MYSAVVFFLWLVGLTCWIWYSNSRNKQRNLDQDKLNDLLKEAKQWQELKGKSLESVSKVYLKRFNPYQDTGGDQSFAVALLNSKGNGIVISSLHGRNGTRVFAKPVKLGKEDRFQFSDEEKETVTEAMKTGF